MSDLKIFTENIEPEALNQIYTLVKQPAFADVNPNEIAAHIADGTLADWCELWRQQATVAAENLRLSEKD